MVTSCPTDVIRARAERIWDLFTHTQDVERWTGMRLVGSHRVLAKGDRILFSPGFGLERLGLKMRWDILEMVPPRQLTMDVKLPLGMTNHEVVVISPVDEEKCRVTLN